MPEVINRESIDGKRRKRKKSSGLLCSKKRRKVDPVVTSYEKCCFCYNGPNKKMGNFFQDSSANLAAHQFCLLFSAGLPQLGDDNEGFEGFLFKDIMKEVQRVNKLVCKFCGKLGANAGCCISHCKMLYHYHCGMKEGLQFIFSGSFDTYCFNHRSYQDLSQLEIRGAKSTCPICLETVELKCCSKDNILKTPCCKNVFMHKSCVQRQATVSGYFFRCPCCNNKEDFNKEMALYGLYIPSRDAAWEEREAFVDLLQEYDKCDVKNCLCQRGRNYSTLAGKWHLIRCHLCGQSAVHVKCLGKHYIPGVGYVCLDCNKVARHNQSSNANIVQPGIHERLKEHKRRLQELTSRDDPVLLASCVFRKRILCKKFNIKDCNVNLYNLNIPPKTTKITSNEVNELLGKQHEFENYQKDKMIELQKDLSIDNTNLSLPEARDNGYNGSDSSTKETYSKIMQPVTCDGKNWVTNSDQKTTEIMEQDLRDENKENRNLKEDKNQILIGNSFETLSIKLNDSQKLDENSNVINDNADREVHSENVPTHETVSTGQETCTFDQQSCTGEMNLESHVTIDDDIYENISKNEQKKATDISEFEVCTKAINSEEQGGKESDAFAITENDSQVLSSEIKLNEQKVNLESKSSTDEIKTGNHVKNTISSAITENIAVGLDSKIQLNLQNEDAGTIKDHDKGGRFVSDENILLVSTSKIELKEQEKETVSQVDERKERETLVSETKDCNEYDVPSKRYNIIVKMLSLDPSEMTSNIEFGGCPTKEAPVWKPDMFRIDFKFEKPSNGQLTSQDPTKNVEIVDSKRQLIPIVEKEPVASEICDKYEASLKKSFIEDSEVSYSSNDELDDAASEHEGDNKTINKTQDKAKITAAILREIDSLFSPPFKKRRYVYRNFLGSHLVHRYHIPKRSWIRAKLHQMAYKDTEMQIIKK